MTALPDGVVRPLTMYDGDYGRGRMIWGGRAAGVVRDFMAHLPVDRVDVLDAMCGSGKNAAALAAAGANVDAFDASKNALNIAEQTWGTGVNWNQADAERFPFNWAKPGYGLILLQGAPDCFTRGTSARRFMRYLIDDLLLPDGVLMVTSFHDRLQSGLRQAHVADGKPVVHWIPPADHLLSAVSPLRVHPGTIEDIDEDTLHGPTFLPHVHAMLRFEGHKPSEPRQTRQWPQDARDTRDRYLMERHLERVRAMDARSPDWQNRDPWKIYRLPLRRELT